MRLGSPVIISARAEKDLTWVPKYIIDAFRSWRSSVESVGLFETSKNNGFHMEKLRGDREGQYSVRLNRAYRAIYEVDTDGQIHIVTVLEVNKHKY